MDRDLEKYRLSLNKFKSTNNQNAKELEPNISSSQSEIDVRSLEPMIDFSNKEEVTNHLPTTKVFKNVIFNKVYY